VAKLKWMLLVCLPVLAVVGCTSKPVYNVMDAPVIPSSGKSASMQDIRSAIIRAGVPLGWQIIPGKPGQLTGRLVVRSHQAVVDIEHNLHQYSIKYRDSVNLGAMDGQVHRSYNSWVQDLDKAIRLQISQL
jgi:hypothetical protein